ncbi:hypothetical protein HG535_0C00115 [Zygotorulaspora mrakii]|uniref:Uncharacterized protein n=1 Tax=Zygotorulaspora mrakii TaxID=42260 RepID=A0A7H9AZ20_ZYGMR|nr:uncharacterized protein HG535_0C00115 [Zygotorulaspora mrakii]QLG71665.1 hypothetical protein HG535_0C00115 [Zygotorulaspora mrakii]
MLGDELNLRLGYDNRVFARVIKTREFIFTESDFAVLSEYKSQRTRYVAFSQMYLHYVYLRAERTTAKYVNKDMKAGIASMVKTLSPNTINLYVVKLAHKLFVLFNGHRLSPFEEYAFLPEDEISLLTENLEIKEKVSEKMEILGRCFSSCIRSDEYREHLVRWICMCPFDFPTWDSFELACPENTVSKVRRLLDTIQFLVRFTSFATTEMLRSLKSGLHQGRSFHLRTFGADSASCTAGL